MRKTAVNLLVTIVVILATTSNSYSQIFQSRIDIIDEYGFDYKSGITDDGTKYITYEKEYTSESSGTYTQYKTMYFMESDDGTEFCHYWVITEPITEVNGAVRYFKNQFVEVGYLEWKDYETNILYKVETDDGLCFITAWYDVRNR